MRTRLCNDIETSLKRKMLTPKDFEYLRQTLFDRIGVLLSPTTLKRIWGYIEETVEPRETTLSFLAQFLGYDDWHDYCHRADSEKEIESNPVISRKLNVGSMLEPGDTVRLFWHPDRRCEAEYTGNLTFKVKSAENTRIQPGDTFECALIIAGEPLYIDNLTMGGRMPVAYVCGRKSGVRFEVLPADETQPSSTPQQPNKDS